MATKTVLLGVAVGSIVCGGYATEVIGRELPFKAKYSGSGMSAYPDPNHDGIRAGTGVLGCTSNLGRCTAQGVGEAVYTGSATCPNGNPGIGLELIPGTGHGFTRFDKGDMLFSELVTESVCYDPSLRMHFKSGTGKIHRGHRSIRRCDRRVSVRRNAVGVVSRCRGQRLCRSGRPHHGNHRSARQLTRCRESRATGRRARVGLSPASIPRADPDAPAIRRRRRITGAAGGLATCTRCRSYRSSRCPTAL